jgi:putative restriction endonuclease
VGRRAADRKVLEQFGRLNVWSRGSERAPHKPLLVLYALGRWARGERGDLPFAEVAPALTDLLREFGPPRRSLHPEYPFWRLQNDGVWQVQADGDQPLRPRRGHDDPPKSELLAHSARGNFTPEVQAALTAHPGLVREIAAQLLQAHFPDSLHGDILATVGLSLDEVTTVKGKKRDPRFRQRVLVAYEFACAVCLLKLQLGSVHVALEAAHIKWVQACGPDEEANGLALCSLHHKLFDLGAFTVTKDSVLLVSDRVHGDDEGFHQALLRHHGGRVREAQKREWWPRAEFLAWHGKEVFKGAARERP